VSVSVSEGSVSVRSLALSGVGVGVRRPSPNAGGSALSPSEGRHQIEHSFYSGSMTGGMGRGRGTPLRDRVAMIGRESVPLPAATPSPRRRRHCWVRPDPHDTTQVEGLVLQWAKEGDTWVALVQFVLERGGEAIAVQRWLPASRLRPAV
jgi:hypothetical protein